jgi:hypothetical protein
MSRQGIDCGDCDGQCNDDYYPYLQKTAEGRFLRIGVDN